MGNTFAEVQDTKARYQKCVLVAFSVIIAVSIAIIWGAKAWNKWRVSENKRQESEDVATARQWAGLAPLPPSTQDLKVFRNAAFTWTGYYIKFTAAPQEINAFLAASPGLRATPVEIFSPKHPYSDTHFSDRVVVKRVAPWFDRSIEKRGRCYKSLWQGNFGEVIVNDRSHAVYIYVADS